jgi:hypothetical protein
MSYLDVPRIHFGGLFFTNPSTINNFDRSYNPGVPLTNGQGAYVSVPPGGPPAGWNAVGTAQLWLSECAVLSAVGPGGTLVSADPIVGALVESPSPSTPKTTPDGKGFYDIAKLVDLDPDQQGRSAVYGLRIFVTLPGGGGFSGLMSVPELQNLNGRVVPPNSPSSWSAVGTWMGQITEVEWMADPSSPFLAEFQQACQLGIAVKLTTDLHQNNFNTRLTPGNLFCYGRVLGSLGPIHAGELAQVVPGRQIATPPAPAPAAALRSVALEAAPSPRRTLALGAKPINDRFGGGEGGARLRSAAPTPAAADAADVAVAATSDPSLQWNPAPAQVSQGGSGSLLHIDLGGSLQLQGTSDASGIWSSNGQFLQDTGISVGVLTSAGIQPLANGQISFANQYVPLNSQNKQVDLVTSSGLVDVALESNEAALVQTNPLVITVNGTTVLQEPANGLFLGSNPFSVRLTPGASAEVQVMARQFGQPVVGQQPLTWEIDAVATSSGQLAPSTNVSLAWDGSTDANGIATLTVSTVEQDPTLPAYRQPMDSQVYYVFFSDLAGQAIGDGNANANVSVLRFQSYVAPANPTWQQDVGPILQAYARLYPGMKDRLDIGDEATVAGFASSMLARMALPFLDPAYMPVTRDLSPAKVAMILAWLKTQANAPSA